MQAFCVRDERGPNELSLRNSICQSGFLYRKEEAEAEEWGDWSLSQLSCTVWSV